MTFAEQLSQFWILVPSVLMLLTGSAIALQAGHARLSDTQGVRQLGGNLSSTILLVAACLVALAVVQGIVGYNMRAAW